MGEQTVGFMKPAVIQQYCACTGTVLEFPICTIPVQNPTSICMPTPFYHGPCTCINLCIISGNIGRSERNICHVNYIL